MGSKLFDHVCDLEGVVVVEPQVVNDVVESFVFLLHLLVVTPALVCSPGTNERRHALKDLVHSPELLVLKVAVVHLQEPVVFLLLEHVPVANELPGLQRLFHPLLLLDFLLLEGKFVELVEDVEIAFVVLVQGILELKLGLLKVEHRQDRNLPILHIKLHLNINNHSISCRLLL